jgi:hypothetical protein
MKIEVKNFEFQNNIFFNRKITCNLAVNYKNATKYFFVFTENVHQHNKNDN